MPAVKTPKPPVASGQKPVPSGPHVGRKVGGGASWLRKALIRRGEKLVFVGCVVAFFVFCGLGLRRLPYGKSPADLKAEADKVLKDLDAAKAPPKVLKELAKSPDLKALETAALKDIHPQAYGIAPLKSPIRSGRLRRGQPKVFPVESLLASAGYGPIAIKGASEAAPTSAPRPRVAAETVQSSGASDEKQRFQKLQELRKKQAEGRLKTRGPARAAKPPKNEVKPVEEPVAEPALPKERPTIATAPSGSHLEERSWVCLVGAIPYLRQLDQYDRAFGGALFQSVERDLPRYSLPEIERAEIVNGRRMRWRSVHVIAALEDHANWAADYPEPLDPRLIDPELTEPLPPLVLANYEKAELNHPQVKVVLVQKPKPDETTSSVGKSSDETAKDDKKSPPQIFNLRQKKNETSATSPPKTADADKASPTTPEKSADEPPEERIAYRMFRFFDFDVQPGKTYCYRVKLVAINPNYELPAYLLRQPAASSDLFLHGNWSSPSAPVSVVRGTRLLAGAIHQDESDSSFSEPFGQILVRFFDFATSIQAFALVDVTRGSVLNQTIEALPVGEPRSTSGSSGKRSTNQDKASDSKVVDVKTDAIVLDLFGGDRIAGHSDRKVPGHVLVLDKHGRFKTLLQSDDAETYETDIAEARHEPVTIGAKNQQAAK